MLYDNILDMPKQNVKQGIKVKPMYFYDDETRISKTEYNDLEDNIEVIIEKDSYYDCYEDWLHKKCNMKGDIDTYTENINKLADEIHFLNIKLTEEKNKKCGFIFAQLTEEERHLVLEDYLVDHLTDAHKGYNKYYKEELYENLCIKLNIPDPRPPDAARDKRYALKKEKLETFKKWAEEINLKNN